MIRILGTVFAGLLGLAFGSFLNVCLTRWPQGESIVTPRSHCRNCDHTLAWWENIPLVSWLALRGRCRNCRVWIGWRYPVVELAVGTLWVWTWCRFILPAVDADFLTASYLMMAARTLLLTTLLVGLAILDAEHFWLPDAATLTGIALGLIFRGLSEEFRFSFDDVRKPFHSVLQGLIAAVVAGGLILLMRWLYKLIRHREGIGLGDAKLMAMLGAWLGLPGALLAFALGAVLGAIFALILLAIPASQTKSESWTATKLPLGAFLCIGGIVSALWGEAIIAAYRRWAGF